MILETERLILKKMCVEDTPFYFELFNDPDWIKNINDKGLRTIDDTRIFLENEFIPNLCVNGLGFFTVFNKETNQPIGTSSILQRETLSHPDIGYAFLPKGRGKGYATEASLRMIKYAKEALHQDCVYAITKPNNHPSKKLLNTLGFTYLGDQKIFTELDSVFKLDNLDTYIEK